MTAYELIAMLSRLKANCRKAGDRLADRLIFEPAVKLATKKEN